MMVLNVVPGLADKRFSGILLFFMVFVCTSNAVAYNLYSFKWPQPSTTFYVSIPGADGLWNDAFETAMYYWGVDTNFKFLIVRDVYEDPCDATDGRNGVSFGATNCGDAWGTGTLAITQNWYNVGTSAMIQSDIVFNSNEQWNVYTTAWNSYPWYGVDDFSRVAVHELGHVLGLDHEDSDIPSIMRSIIGNVIIPQQDDINGVRALYGNPVGDIDGDGVPDSVDNCPFTSNANQADSDSDSIGNVCDSCPYDQFNDLDSDGVCGNVDICPADPLKSVSTGQCGCNVPETDTDKDGTPDCLDLCIGDPLKVDPGVCGCSVADTDMDNDGVVDCHDSCLSGDNDIDKDGDKIPDACDGCPSDPNKGTPGKCGCNIPESSTDVDNDGILDCLDVTDYDMDGFTDKQEIICGSNPADRGSRCRGDIMPFMLLLLKE